MQLKTPKNNKATGLHIFCNRCHGEPTDGVCKKKDTAGNACAGKCKFPDRHTYKVRIHLSDGTKKFKTLKTRNLPQAVTEAIYFYKEIKTGEQIQIVPAPSLNRSQEMDNTNSKTDIATLIKNYLQEVSPDNDEITNVRQVGIEHLKDVRKCLEFLTDVLFDMGMPPTKYPPECITREIARNIVSKVIKTQTPYTAKRHISAYRRFFNYLKQTQNWNYTNQFNGSWKIDFPELKKEVLTADEFKNILAAIDTAPRIGMNKKGKPVTYWRPWLRDAFILGLITGCRNQEIANMKYSDYKFNDQTPHLIAKDIKGSKLRQKETVRKININEDMMDFLKTDRHRNLLDADQYIIAGDDDIKSRKYLAGFFGKAFTYYREQAGITKKVFFKTLRKTYATLCAIRDGKESASQDIHRGSSTTQKHYFNDLVIQAAVQKKGRLFGGETM
jgi:integrase